MDYQYYSKIAKMYLEKRSKEDNLEYTMICYGNLNDMENLFDLFNGNREKEFAKSKSWNHYIYLKFSFVMNKLDRESKKPNAIFEKSYISYPGIIKRATRCFVLRENK